MCNPCQLRGVVCLLLRPEVPDRRSLRRSPPVPTAPPVRFCHLLSLQSCVRCMHPSRHDRRRRLRHCRRCLRRCMQARTRPACSESLLLSSASLSGAWTAFATSPTGCRLRISAQCWRRCCFPCLGVAFASAASDRSLASASRLCLSPFQSALQCLSVLVHPSADRRPSCWPASVRLRCAAVGLRSPAACDPGSSVCVPAAP